MEFRWRRGTLPCRERTPCREAEKRVTLATARVRPLQADYRLRPSRPSRVGYRLICTPRLKPFISTCCLVPWSALVMPIAGTV